MAEKQSRQRLWRRTATAAALLGIGALAALLLLTADGEAGGEAEAGGRTELIVRSANLVVKDLAEEWDEQHYQTEPFEMCGRAKLTTRETKICADHFLTLIDAAHRNVTELPPNGQLRGLPDLNVFSECFKAKSYYQVKACVRLVSREITTGDVERLQEDGVIHKGGLIAAVAHSAIARARGMDNVNGLNGGLTPEMGEMSTADYSKKLNSTGRPPVTDGCEQLGVGGCREDGGLDPSIKERAMQNLSPA